MAEITTVKKPQEEKKSETISLKDRIIETTKTRFGTSDHFTKGFLLPEGSIIYLPHGRHGDSVSVLRDYKDELTDSQNKMLDIPVVRIRLFQEMSGAVRIGERKEGKTLDIEIIAPNKPTEKQWEVLEDTIWREGVALMEISIRYQTGGEYKSLNN